MTAGYKPTDEDGLAEAWGEADRAAPTPSQAPAVPSDERAAFELAMKESWQMVDPLRPPPAGSYYAGEHAGICAALKTVRENFTRHCQKARAALTAAPTPPAQPAKPELPIELADVSRQIEEGKGIWRSCTGCHDSNEGVPTGPFSRVFQCHLGLGCSECGGLGAIWDDTDYDGMAAFMASADSRPAQPAVPESADGGLTSDPVAWRWFNSNGQPMSNWLVLRPRQRNEIESQVADARGRIEYAYLQAPPAVPEDVARDAERYRFIRDADRSDCITREISIYAMETLDEYVDTAMAGELAARAAEKGGA